MTAYNLDEHLRDEDVTVTDEPGAGAEAVAGDG